MNRLLILAVMITAGCTPDFDAESAAKAIVSESLKDPTSAKWGKIEVAKLHEGYVACGTVSAKNSFGGYTGDAHFRAMFSPEGKGGADIADDPRFGILQATGCKIIFEIAARHSDPSKWPQEKKELLSRTEKSAKELAPILIKMKL